MEKQSRKGSKLPLMIGGAIAGSMFLFVSPLIDSIPNKPEQSKFAVLANFSFSQKITEQSGSQNPLTRKTQILAEIISKKLARLEHLTPKNYDVREQTNYRIAMANPSPEELSLFGHEILFKIFYTLDALSDSRFRVRIGRELELDEADRSTEHGGFFLLNENDRLSIRMVQSRPTENPFYSKGDDPDEFYYPVSEIKSQNIIAWFHFHVGEKDNSDYAAPFDLDFIHPGEVVFTKIGKGQFNADIALILNKGDTRLKVDLDLGVYRY